MHTVSMSDRRQGVCQRNMIYLDNSATTRQ